MAFSIFTAKRVSRLGQYNRIDNLIPLKLRSEECRVFWQFLVDEFHFPAVFKPLDPLFVWHFCSASSFVRPLAVNTAPHKPPITIGSPRVLSSRPWNKTSDVS